MEARCARDVRYGIEYPDVSSPRLLQTVKAIDSTTTTSSLYVSFKSSSGA